MSAVTGCSRWTATSSRQRAQGTTMSARRRPRTITSFPLLETRTSSAPVVLRRPWRRVLFRARRECHGGADREI